MKVIKRDCSEVLFDATKIKKAILKAMKNGSGRVDECLAEDIAAHIYSECIGKEEVSIYDIEKMVFDNLCFMHHEDTARAYEGFRAVREHQRMENTIDGSITELLNGDSEYWNTENSNKNPKVVTTQRDYLAGITSDDISRRKLLPPDVVQAHDEGILHFHDIDYFAQRTLHNCFSGNTKFVTSEGVKSFNDFRNDDVVEVMDKNGDFREAIVKCYGKKKMFDITFTTPQREKVVTCTSDHRWILKDGTVTTNLKIGDSLIGLAKKETIEPITVSDCLAFTLGFLIGDGCDHKTYHQVRLCGNKIKYVDIFKKAGYSISSLKDTNDLLVTKKGLKKQEFLNSKAWKFMPTKDKSLLFYGLYCADGTTKANKLCTSDERVAELIRDTSCLFGYHITRETIEVRDTEFKKDSHLIAFGFTTSQPVNLLWKVKEIKPHHDYNYENRRASSEGNAEINAWCVEEPITHSFTLEGGMITGNCDLINLEDMLQNGTMINGVKIDKPHRFLTAMTIATQIITAVTSSQYGGASISLAHLAPFVRDSYESYKKKYKERGYGFEGCCKYALEDLKKEIVDGVQTFNYQINSMSTTNGQSPFLSVFMYLGETEEYKKELSMIIEEFLHQRIKGMKNEKGVYISPAFPKLLYVTEDDNITEDSPYWYLTELAAKCTAKRLVPDYISEKEMKRLKSGNCFPVMGCRSALSDWKDEGGKSKFYGRFNQGVVTISLPDVALSSYGDFDKFWSILDERAELCHKALMVRHKRLEGTLSDVAPILWQHGALARLKKGETIDKLLHGGYSTLSLGYAGLYECVKYMTKHSHTEDGKAFGLEVMQRLSDKCDEWKEQDDIGYSTYGSPIESTTYKFAKCLKKRFGIVEGITDRNYITNSYHVPVFEEIDAFTKLKLESEFQSLSSGGAVSYVEVPNMQNNTLAVLDIIKFIHNNIMYAEINTKSDYCQVCDYDGEMLIDDNLEWYCPNCHNKDQDKMNVIRRTCGYCGSNYFNKGRTQEIKERVLHI